MSIASITDAPEIKKENSEAAIAVGSLSVAIFYRGGNLLRRIFAHSAIDALDTFANDSDEI